VGFASALRQDMLPRIQSRDHSSSTHGFTKRKMPQPLHPHIYAAQSISQAFHARHGVVGPDKSFIKDGGD
jgi:hypothetical protein